MCYVCVLSRVQLFMTPLTVARQASLSMGFPGKNWSGLPLPFPGDLPDPGMELTSALTGIFFTTSTTWEAHYGQSLYKKGKFGHRDTYRENDM